MFWCKKGFNIPRGTKIKVTKQIKESWAPFSMGHYVVHRANLTIQSLSNFTFIARLELFLTKLYSYFNHSPKRHLKFQRLVQTLEINRNKILKNVKTMQMSMLELLKRVMVQCHPLLAVMQQNSNTNQLAKVSYSFMTFIMNCKLNSYWLNHF